jgi:hypothetical protein
VAVMDAAAFVLDADVFITAKNRYYAFDLAPGFWNSLIHHSGSGRILSIDYVKGELEKGKDQLAQWAKNDFSHAFISTDEGDVQESYKEIMTWVQGQNQFSDAAKADFARGADGWLVAYAKAKGCIVVTLETINPEIKRKVPIPNVCQAFGVQFVDTFEMLRRLGVQLTS